VQAADEPPHVALVLVLPRVDALLVGRLERLLLLAAVRLLGFLGLVGWVEVLGGWGVGVCVYVVEVYLGGRVAGCGGLKRGGERVAGCDEGEPGDTALCPVPPLPNPTDQAKSKRPPPTCCSASAAFIFACLSAMRAALSALRSSGSSPSPPSCALPSA